MQDIQGRTIEVGQTVAFASTRYGTRLMLSIGTVVNVGKTKATIQYFSAPGNGSDVHQVFARHMVVLS